MSEPFKVGTFAFPLSVLRPDAFPDAKSRWAAAHDLGQMNVGAWLDKKHPDHAANLFCRFQEEHSNTPDRVWRKLQQHERHYAIGMKAEGWHFNNGSFWPEGIDALVAKHPPGGQPLVVLPRIKLDEWRKTAGDERLRHVICAVRSIIGKKPFARVTTSMIGARMNGYPSPSKCPVPILPRQQIRTLLSRIGSEVSRVYAGGKFTWMSTSMKPEALAEAIKKRGKRVNFVNLLRAKEDGNNHKNRPDDDGGWSTAIIEANQNNSEQPPCNHTPTTEQPQANRNNLDSQYGFRNTDSELGIEQSSGAVAPSLSGDEILQPEPEPESEPPVAVIPEYGAALKFATELKRDATDIEVNKWFAEFAADPKGDWKKSLSRVLLNGRRIRTQIQV